MLVLHFSSTFYQTLLFYQTVQLAYQLPATSYQLYSDRHKGSNFTCKRLCTVNMKSWKWILFFLQLLGLINSKLHIKKVNQMLNQFPRWGHLRLFHKQEIKFKSKSLSHLILSGTTNKSIFFCPIDFTISQNK